MISGIGSSAGRFHQYSAQRCRWGKEEQGSGRSFRPKAETEVSGLCDDANERRRKKRRRERYAVRPIPHQTEAQRQRVRFGSEEQQNECAMSLKKLVANDMTLATSWSE